MFELYNRLVRLRAFRLVVVLAAYTVAMFASLWLSYLLRFDFDLPNYVAASIPLIASWVIVVKLLLLMQFGQCQDSLSYFSTPDVARIASACSIASLVLFAVYLAGGIALAPPRGVIITDLVLSGAFLCLGRVSLRLLRERFLAPQTRPGQSERRIGIIGAGDAGAALVHDLFINRWLGLRPICFFDESRSRHSRVHGVPVWGPPELLDDPKMALKLDEVIFAIPHAGAERVREIVKMLQRVKIPFRTIPSITELAMGTVDVSNLRPLQIEDLLGRDVVKIETESIRSMVADRVVMVTGAGGSIGSELCRQIATFGPRLLLLCERSEAALFPVEQELIERGFHYLIVPLVADVTDLPRMSGIFSAYRPHAVFHAAAHKHVPLMESQPGEAIRNNVLGTAQLAELACTFEVERFLLVSTDKAINPTSVMGATKRLAELTVQAMQAREFGPTKFMAVRFGNVLGSSGSVVPIFSKQIATGGPVKVTHPEVTRYFMTIPEAVSLVLQSAAQGAGGEIFVLEMGRPVKIVDLARQMIELSGRKPGVDIEIEFTGLRPGEKLYEELSHVAECVTPTDHPNIRRLVAQPRPYAELAEILEDLETAVALREPSLKLMLKRLLPEYTPDLQPELVVAEPTPVVLAALKQSKEFPRTVAAIGGA